MKNAFTLIELILVVAILLIITTVAAPFYSRFLLQNDSALIVDQISGQLRKAQIYSISGKLNSAWGIHYGDNTLTLFAGNTYFSRNAALDETFSLNPNISVAGLNDIVFTRPKGIPTSALNITVSSYLGSKNITVNSQGMVESL